MVKRLFGRIPACVVVVPILLGVALAGAPPVKTGTSILFADERSMECFAAYRTLVESDAVTYADRLATLRRLEQSDVQYVVSIGGEFAHGVEGKITTDGERIMICVSDGAGGARQFASLVSRLAHELEHARQFDAGELALMRDPKTGQWASHYSTYDIGDEVLAWSAQLSVAQPQDYWFQRKGTWYPTVLRLFANAVSDTERAQLLQQNGYSGLNPVFGCNVRFGLKSGLRAGQLLRPDETNVRHLFARVYAVGPDAPSAVAVD
jgi:hypothetical protein